MAERARVLRFVGLAVLLYASAFLALTVAGANRSGVAVWGAGLLLAAAAILLQLALSRARSRDLLSPATLLRVPLVVTVLGLVVAVLVAVTKVGGGALALAGVVAAYLAFGQALAEWRRREGRWRGPTLCASFTGLLAAAIVLCIGVNAWFLLVAVIPLLAIPIGLTLLSEDVMEGRLAGYLRRWLWAPIGAVVAVIGVLLLIHRTDVPKELAWPLAAALFALVGAIASSSQADVLLVVTALALAWTAIPAGAGTGDALDPAATGPTLVALGDSYMSGEGAAEYFEGTNRADEDECRRAPTAYAHRVVEFDRAEGIGRLAFFACSGALAANIHEDPQHGQIQLDRLLRRGVADIELVIVSIGGNDAGFSKIGGACLAPGSCVALGQRWLDRLDGVAAEVKRAYTEIRKALAYKVPVVAVPYPVPIASRSCPHSLLENDEHQFLHRYVKQLNGVLRQTARDAHVYYLDDMAEVFSNDLRICDGERDEAGVNFVALKSVNGLVDQALNPAKWIHNSLHPNELGHEAMATALDEWLRAHPEPHPWPRGADRPEKFTRKPLERLMGPDVSYCGDRDGDQPAHCDRKDVPWTITQAGTLLANATLPALVLVAGCWLVWIPVLARTRPRWNRLGGCVARELLGPPPPSGQPADDAAAAVQRASST